MVALTADINSKDCPPAPPPAAALQQQQPGNGEACFETQYAWATNRYNTGLYGDQFVPDLVDAIAGGLGEELCSANGKHPAYKQPVVIDVGANLGQGMPMWVHLVNCTGATVVAFEPHPRTFVQLYSNSADIAAAHGIPRDRVALVAAAAGASQTFVPIFENFGMERHKMPKAKRAKYGGSAFLFKPLPWSEAGSTYTSLHQTHQYKTRRLTVRMVRADQTVSAKVGCDRGILLLKTDAEGHDLQALEGAQGLLHRVEVVVFEYNSLWRAVNNSLGGAAALLRRNGFATFLLGAKVLSLDTSPVDGAQRFNLYPEQQLTGLGIRRGGRTACLLRPFVLSRAVDPKCEALLSDALGCTDDELMQRPLRFPKLARSNSWTNQRLKSAAKTFRHRVKG